MDEESLSLDDRLWQSKRGKRASELKKLGVEHPMKQAMIELNPDPEFWSGIQRRTGKQRKPRVNNDPRKKEAQAMNKKEINTNGVSIMEKYKLLCEHGLVPDHYTFRVLTGCSEAVPSQYKGEWEKRGWKFELLPDGYYRVTKPVNPYEEEIMGLKKQLDELIKKMNK